MYRAQFPFPSAPAPCNDQRCTYSFDATNLPALNASLAPGQQTGRIPLRLDKDADFYMRGASIFSTPGRGGRCAVRLEDPMGNPLSDSDNQLAVTNFLNPLEYLESSGAGVVALETGPEGIFAPAGGNFILLLANLSPVLTVDLTIVAITLHGVKRYGVEVCA